MAEDIQDPIGGCSPYDKLLVACSLGVVKSFGGKETHIAVRASPQGLEKVIYFGTPVNETHKVLHLGREGKWLQTRKLPARRSSRCNYMNNAHILIKGH